MKWKFDATFFIVITQLAYSNQKFPETLELV